jgi:hypothetical protein
MMRAIDLPAQAKTLYLISATLENMIRIDRRHYNLDQTKPGKAALFLELRRATSGDALRPVEGVATEGGDQ